jgi:hypothetical protein
MAQKCGGNPKSLEQDIRLLFVILVCSLLISVKFRPFTKPFTRWVSSQWMDLKLVKWFQILGTKSVSYQPKEKNGISDRILYFLKRIEFQTKEKIIWSQKTSNRWNVLHYCFISKKDLRSLLQQKVYIGPPPSLTLLSCTHKQPSRQAATVRGLKFR